MKNKTILYGIPSEGMGHATRSQVIIDWLLNQNYDVVIATSGKAFELYNKNYKNVIAIDGYHLAFKNAQVSLSKTFAKTIAELPQKIKTNFKQIKQIVNNYNIDIVISDFESFSHFYAKAYSLPLISIDNIQVLDRCKLDIKIPKSEKLNFEIAKAVTFAKVAGANHYLISNFFEATIKKKNTKLVPPILRNQILNIKPTTENHILIYQTAMPQDKLVAELKQLPREVFYVYGFNKEEQVAPNVYLKKFSETTFISLLANCKAVLCNGGYSFISEAIYLHKPICTMPIANQCEQYINAAYVQQLGYGKHVEAFIADLIKSFIYDLPYFQEALKNYTQDGNNRLFESIRDILKTF